MAVPSHGDQRRNLRPGEAVTFALLKYPLSANRVSGLPSASGDRAEPVQHRLDLLLVVGDLHHIGGHHQEADRRTALGVVGLFEAAGRQPA